MNLLMIGLLALVSVSANAEVLGTPDEDPVIENLRNRFGRGVEPEAAYLLKHTFKCKEISARRGKFDKKDMVSPLSFQSFDGFLTVVQDNTIMNGVLYTFNGMELIGATQTEEGFKLYDAYRMDSQGYLISEYSAFHRNISHKYELLPLASSQGKVVSYVLCVPNISP